MSELIFRHEPLVSLQIRAWAATQPCTARIPDVCTWGDPDRNTVVWAHAPSGVEFGKGLALKPDDLLGAAVCRPCHACIDGDRSWYRGDPALIEIYFWRAHAMSLIRLRQDGLLVHALDLDDPNVIAWMEAAKKIQHYYARRIT